MLSHFRAATPALCILWIAMAQIAGQEDRERTTALKGNVWNLKNETMLFQQTRYAERGKKIFKGIWH